MLNFGEDIMMLPYRAPARSRWTPEAFAMAAVVVAAWIGALAQFL